MTQFLSELRAACLPFVTRSLRGHRLRLTWAAAVLLSMVSLVGGLWMAQSIGARAMRTELRWETPPAQREIADFTIYADTENEERHLRRLVDRIAEGEAPSHGRLQRVTNAACAGMTVFGFGDDAQPADADLVARARQATASPVCQTAGRSIAATTDPQWVQAVLDRDLAPRVRRYHSPLGIAATLGAIGMFAGGIVGIGLLFVAPLLIGLQMAQEVHDNTLQPLTGTALTARHLAVGIASGPLTAIGIALCGPLALWAIGAIATGNVLAGLGTLATVVAASGVLIFGAQLVAMTLGRHRSPGIVTIVLAIALGSLTVTGIALGLQVERSTVGLIATLPGSASVLLWMKTFAPFSEVSAYGLHSPMARVLLGACGMLTLTGIAIVVLERKILTRGQGLLSRGEAAFATVVLAGMALVAVPSSTDDFASMYLLSLFALLGPLQLVLMTRVPVGSLPPKMRTIPLSALLVEYAAALGIHLVMTLFVAETPDLAKLGPGGILHLGWALTVLALMTIRGTATPTSIPARLWFGFVLVAVFVELGLGAALASSGHGNIFPLEHVPALMGLLYLAMLMWAPVSLALGLTRAGAKVT